MTPKQLRALDAKIGREIMGYNVQPLTNFLVGSMRDDGYDYCTVNDHGDPGVLPLFTTSVDAALLVISKLYQQGAIEFCLEHKKCDAKWFAAFIMENMKFHCAEASTAAMAICLSAEEMMNIRLGG